MKVLIFSLTVAVSTVSVAQTQVEEEAQSQPVVKRAYVNLAEPFAFINEDGELDGAEVFLIREVFTDLPEELELQVLQDPNLKNKGLEETEADFIFGAFTRSAERMELFRFSIATYASEMRIGYPFDAGKRLGTQWHSLISAGFHPIQLLLSLCLLPLGVSLFRTIQSPKRRQLAGGLTICGIVMIGGMMFTSLVNNALSHRPIEAISGFSGPFDLERVKVATKASTPSGAIADTYGAYVKEYPTLEEAVRATIDGDAVVVVHEGPILDHLVLRDQIEMELVGRPFAPQFYAAGFRLDEDPHFVQRFNHVLQKKLEDEKVRRAMASYRR